MMKLDTAAATEPRFPCREVTPTYAAPIRHPHCPNGAARPLSHRHGSSSKWPFFRNTVQTRRLFRRPTPKSTGGAFRICNESRVRLRRDSTRHTDEGGANPCRAPNSRTAARFDFGLAGYSIVLSDRRRRAQLRLAAELFAVSAVKSPQKILPRPAATAAHFLPYPSG